jgi:hypothetical protein
LPRERGIIAAAASCRRLAQLLTVENVVDDPQSRLHVALGRHGVIVSEGIGDRIIGEAADSVIAEHRAGSFLLSALGNVLGRRQNSETDYYFALDLFKQSS